MMKDVILFDLDGTLTDPAEGITNSVAYALRHYGIEVADRRTLTPFIGPPLAESFRKFFGFSEVQAKEAVEVYREYFSSRGILENRVYEGIPAMLASLQAAGKTLVLATSKPWVYAEQILAHFSLDRYFSFVAGSELDHRRVDKHEVIEYALESLKMTDRERVVMVGDRLHDMIGAKKSSLTAVGVLYGYGSREELEAAGADTLCEDVASLTDLLLTI